MRDANKTIEKVMAELRECQPPEGLEGGVLRALRQREHAGAVRSGPGLWKAPAYAALGAAAVAAGIFAGVHSPAKTVARIDADLRVNAPALRAPSLPALFQNVSGSTAKFVSAEDRDRGPRRAIARRLSRDLSYPAPPLPLTEQEKLLLQIARRRAPQAVTQLSPETQIAQAARDKEEFRRFFNPQDGETN